MAPITKRALRVARDTREDVADELASHLETLRQDLAAIAEAVNAYGLHRWQDARDSAGQLARQVQDQLPVVAREAGRRAAHVGKAVRNDPVPVIVAVGTLALLSTLFFRRR